MSSASAALARRIESAPTGYLYMLLAVFCGSTGSVVVKGLLSSTHLPPIPLLACRLILGAVVLWAVMIGVFHQRLKLERRMLLGVVVAGVANAISLSCFYLALTYIDASIAMVVYSTNPIVVLVILSLLGHRLQRIDVIRALIAIVGLILLVGIGGHVAWQGVALTTVTAVLFAVHLVAIQRLLKGYPTAQVAPLIITVMAMCVTAVYLLTSPPSEWFSFPPEGWLVIVYTAVVTTAIARLALVEGIQRVGSGQAALLSPLETTLSVIWAVLFLGERLSPVQLVGGALVLISVALVARRRAVSRDEALLPVDAP